MADKTPKKTLPAPPDPDTGLEIGLARRRVRERHERAVRGQGAVQEAVGAVQTPPRGGIWMSANASTTAATALFMPLQQVDVWGPSWTSSTTGLYNNTLTTTGGGTITPAYSFAAASYDTRPVAQRPLRDLSPAYTPRTQEEIARERKQRVSAERRARDLLFACLTETQRQMYQLQQEFLVASSRGRVFSIGHARMHNVHLLDAQQRRIEEWCVTVVEAARLPVCDILLAQKLHLETDEDAFRRESNVRCLKTGRVLYHAPAQYRTWEEGPYERLLVA